MRSSFIQRPLTAGREARRHALSAAAWLASLAVVVDVAAVAHAQGQPAAPTALPTGARVAAGDALVPPPSGAHLTILQRSERAAIEWQGFDIGEQASVTFRQPGPASVMVNRVVGGDMSRILGALTADGQVFLLNEQGVVFGPQARIDVGGLAVSARQQQDDAWTGLDADRLRAQDAGGGPLQVAGQVTVRQGGVAILQGGEVDVAGSIRSPGGEVWIRGIDVRIGGAEGRDAAIDVDAEGITPSGQIDIRAADPADDPSDVDLRVLGRTVLTASGAGPSGPGGRVTLKSSAGLHVDERAILRVRGGGPEAHGGAIELSARSGPRPAPILDFGEARGGQLTLGAQAWEVGAGERRRRSDVPPDSDKEAPARLKASDLSTWLDQGRSVHLRAKGTIAVTQPLVTTDTGADAGELSMSAPAIRLDATIERAAGDLALSAVKRDRMVGSITMADGAAIQAPGSRVSLTVPARAPSASAGPGDRLTLGVVNARALDVDTGSAAIVITQAGKDEGGGTRADILRAGLHSIMLLPDSNLNLRFEEIPVDGQARGERVAEPSQPTAIDGTVSTEKRIDASGPSSSLPEERPTSNPPPVRVSPETPETPEMLETSGTPKTPETPEMPEMPGTPVSPQAPTTNTSGQAPSSVDPLPSTPPRTSSQPHAPLRPAMPPSMAAAIALPGRTAGCAHRPDLLFLSLPSCESRPFQERPDSSVPRLRVKGGTRPAEDAKQLEAAP